MDSDLILEPDFSEVPSPALSLEPSAATEPCEPREASDASASRIAPTSSVDAAAPSSAPLATGLDVSRRTDLAGGPSPIERVLESHEAAGVVERKRDQRFE